MIKLAIPRRVWMGVGIVFALCVGAAIGLQDIRILYSAILGLVASCIAFKQLVKTQAQILSRGKKLHLLPFISRLLIYAVPLALGIRQERYFNLIVILLCLWTFHIFFILEELYVNYRQVQRKKASGEYK